MTAGEAVVDGVDGAVRAGPRSARYRRLRIANVLVGLVLAGETTVMLLLSNDLSLPVFGYFLGADPITVQDSVQPDRLFGVPVGATVAVFLALAALDHFLVAAPGIHSWYERSLDRRANYARWIEYSVSASLMIVLIAMLAGIRDIAALVAIFAANSAMILFGLLMERQQNPDDPDWSAFWFGSLVGAAPWVAIGIYLGGADGVPGFVWVITVVELVLFFSFAVNMWLVYHRRGPWADYVVGESTYIALSLGSKSLLAWLIFANVLRA